MSTRTDYNQIASKLNYTALDKKLDQLRSQIPPKARKGVAELLAPIAGRLNELRAKGWSYPQLAKELNDVGLPVKVSALRAHLSSKARDTSKHSPVK